MDKAEKVFSKTAAAGKYFNKIDDAVRGAGDYMRKGYQKFKDLMGSEAAEAAGIFGAGLIVSQFAEEIINALKDKAVQAKEPKYFKKLLEANPRLTEEKPEEVAALWSTLYRNAPNMAQDPVAAGAFIVQSINKEVIPEHGGPPIDTYKTLIDIEKGRRRESSDSAWNAATKFLDIL